MHALALGLLAFAPPEAQVDAALAEMELRVARLGEDDPGEAAKKLEAALAEAAQNPHRLADASRSEIVRQARFALVWSQQKSTGRVYDDKAVASMDDAIRSAGAAPPPTTYFDPDERDLLFGPDVAELYRTRSKALASTGTASLDVRCSACRVFVNEHEVLGEGASHIAGPLYLGTYRIIVVWGDQVRSLASTSIVLDRADATETWTPRPPAVEIEVRPSRLPNNQRNSAPRGDGKEQNRLLPRPVEWAGLGIGLGLTIVGSVLLALDERCPGRGNIHDIEECPQVYDNKAQGGALLGLGLGLMIPSAALLAVDETRLRRAKGKQAMLVWTFRF